MSEPESLPLRDPPAIGLAHRVQNHEVMRQERGELGLSFGEELLQGFPYLKVK